MKPGGESGKFLSANVNRWSKTMKTGNEMSGDSKLLKYKSPATRVCAIACTNSILYSSEGYPTEMGDGGNDC